MKRLIVLLVAILATISMHAQEPAHSDSSSHAADSTQFSAPVDQAHYGTNETALAPAYPHLTEQAKRARVEQKRAEADARRIREKD